MVHPGHASRAGAQHAPHSQAYTPQGRNFHGTILEQAKRRQEEAKRKVRWLMQGTHALGPAGCARNACLRALAAG